MTTSGANTEQIMQAPRQPPDIHSGHRPSTVVLVKPE